MLSGAFSEIKHTPRSPPQMRQLIKLADKEQAIEMQWKRKEKEKGRESEIKIETERVL